MITKDNLRALLVSDVQGYDDEGMKKIARTLSAILQNRSGIEARVVSVREAKDEIRSVDIFHYVGGPTYRSILIAAWCKRKNKKIKTILTFTNPIWGYIADIAIRFFTPDIIIVSSEYWQRWANRLSIPYRLLPVSGVDLDRFRPVLLEQRNQLRRKLGLPIDKILALHVGHLKDDRNLKKLIKAQSHSDIHVVIIGSTTTIQSAQLIRQLEQSNCLVIKSYQPSIEEYYQAVDCYIFPTINHRAAIQIPLSVLEAMATNLPIITTQFGGLPAFFPNASGLYYISANRFDDLPKIINKAVASSPETRSIVKNFSWESIANQLHKIYIELMES